MNITINTAGCGGTVPAITSKSEAHRMLIAAALADRETTIRLPNRNADIDATIRCLKAMGARIEEDAALVTITPIRKAPTSRVTLDCGESGSTIRFLLPVAASLGADAVFTGSGSLPSRPQTVMTELLAANGVSVNTDGFPIRLCGKLENRTVSIRGDVSSQYITGLMLAFGAADGGRIRVTTVLQSLPYVMITASVMKAFGVNAVFSDTQTITVPGGGYRSPGLAVPGGDWSNAAPWLCLGALLPDGITVAGLDPQSEQGDRQILEILTRFGARIQTGSDTVSVFPGRRRAFSWSAIDTPDLVPVIAALAAFADGTTRITNAQRLRIKESDRLASTSQLLRGAGIDCTQTDDGLAIVGGAVKPQFSVDACRDHRIVMAAAVLAANADVTVRGAEAIDKSYPSFLRKITERGGVCHVVHDR